MGPVIGVVAVAAVGVAAISSNDNHTQVHTSTYQQPRA
jgi:hypothetical protein